MTLIPRYITPTWGKLSHLLSPENPETMLEIVFETLLERCLGIVLHPLLEMILDTIPTNNPGVISSIVSGHSTTMRHSTHVNAPVSLALYRQIIPTYVVTLAQRFHRRRSHDKERKWLP